MLPANRAILHITNHRTFLALLFEKPLIMSLKYIFLALILPVQTRKYCYQTNATGWSSELYQYRRSNYTGISKRHITPRRIQVRWNDNTIYSDRKQNIMPVITMQTIELSRVIDKAIYCLNIFVFLFIYLHFCTHSYI